MGERSPALLWFRRDLRLSDHPALAAALAGGGPVILVFIRDAQLDRHGAAAKWRLGLSLAALSARLEAIGSRLILRTGPALETLRAVIAETGARAVHWSRLYDPESIARDRQVKAALTAEGIAARSHHGHVIFEPWTVQTGAGGFYRVFSPMWRAVRGREVAAPLPAPQRIPAPVQWPESESLESWRLGAAMMRGAAVCRPYQRVGERAAQERLSWFVETALAAYPTHRNLPAEDGCSGLSENLTYGEISPRQCWHAGDGALQRGNPGAEAWLRELAWREFAWHLAFHSPEILVRNWRQGWDGFPWESDAESPAVLRWKQGRTGVPFVDAAMREMYVTGKMHNRARMAAASYLTKHMLVHWKIGCDWFADCLTDWDGASNAMGWQWVAGCGPDAAPFFRIFNPATQAAKFDPEGRYRRRWIAEGQQAPPRTALAFFDAVPRRWGLSPDAPSPEGAIVGLAEGRARALAAYQAQRR